MTRSASNLFVCSVVLRTLFACSPVVLAGLELCSFHLSCAGDSILVWFVWDFGLDFRRLASCLQGLFLDSILYIRHGSWWFLLSIFIFFTAAGGSSDHSFWVASFFELLRLTQRLSQHQPPQGSY